MTIPSQKSQPRVHVTVRSLYEIEYWARALGCTPRELQAAVHVVGTPAEAVHDYISRKRSARARCATGTTGRRASDRRPGMS